MANIRVCSQLGASCSAHETHYSAEKFHRHATLSRDIPSEFQQFQVEFFSRLELSCSASNTSLRNWCLRAPLAAREAKHGRTVGHGGRRRRGLSPKLSGPCALARTEIRPTKRPLAVKGRTAAERRSRMPNLSQLNVTLLTGALSLLLGYRTASFWTRCCDSTRMPHTCSRSFLAL